MTSVRSVSSAGDGALVPVRSMMSVRSSGHRADGFGAVEGLGDRPGRAVGLVRLLDGRRRGPCAGRTARAPGLLHLGFDLDVGERPVRVEVTVLVGRGDLGGLGRRGDFGLGNDGFAGAPDSSPSDSGPVS